MMSETEANKYKRFLASKQTNNTANTNNTGGSGGGSRKFLEFYAPYKELQTKDKCFCRVLPNKNSGFYFFYEFAKHSFKVGSTYKTAICTYSTNPINDHKISTSCVFCDFINENKEALDKETLKKMQAKDSQVMLVYNYGTDSVQKYETNYYGFTDLTVLLSKLIEEGVSIDNEGFDLIFEKDSNGYTKAVEAHAPKISLEDLFAKSTNVKEIPDIYAECIPTITPNMQNTINATFDYALRAFAPTFAQSSSETETETVSNIRTTQSNSGEEPSYADDSTVPQSAMKVTKSQLNTVGEKTDNKTEDINDENLLDIRDFVESFKQQKENQNQ